MAAERAWEVADTMAAERAWEVADTGSAAHRRRKNPAG
jgi:hypothetical protein